jgi:hypothetical protein
MASAIIFWENTHPHLQNVRITDDNPLKSWLNADKWYLETFWLLAKQSPE